MNAAAFLVVASALAAQVEPLVTVEDGTAEEGTLQDVDVDAQVAGEGALFAWAEASEALSPLVHDVSDPTSLISPSVVLAPSPGPSVVDAKLDARRDMPVRLPDVRPALPAVLWMAGGVGAAALGAGLGLVLFTSVLRATWLARPGARVDAYQRLALDASSAAALGAFGVAGVAVVLFTGAVVTRAALSHVAETSSGLLVDVRDLPSTEGP